MNSAFTGGFSHALPDTYGMKVDELARLLNDKLDEHRFDRERA